MPEKAEAPKKAEVHEKAEVSEAPGEAEAAPVSWRESIEDPQLRRFASRYTGPADLAKSALDFRQKLSSIVGVPGDGAGTQERESYRKAVGIPESPGGYDVALPDGVDLDAEGQDRVERFLGAVHSAEATSKMVRAALDWYFTEAADFVAADERKTKAEADALMATLRKEWGADYDANLEIAKRAADSFAGTDILVRLERETGDAKLIKMFAEICRRMGEDSIGPSLGDDRRQTLEEERDSLMKTPDYWRNEATQRRVREISVRLHGTRPVGQVA